MGTIADLGKAVKAKHPGAYDDMDDASLGKSVKAKFPGAYDDFADEAPRGGMESPQESAAAQPPHVPGTLERVGRFVAGAALPTKGSPLAAAASWLSKGKTDEMNSPGIYGAAPVTSADPRHAIRDLGSPENLERAVTMLGLTLPGGSGKPSPPTGTLAGLAETAAVRSANADRTATRRAFKGSDEARHDLGRFMLDEPEMKLRSPKSIRDAAQDIAGDVGPEIGDLAAKADATGATVSLKTALADALNDRRISSLDKNVMTRGALGGHAGTGHSMGPPGIKDAFADWLAQHGDDVQPSTAHDIRMQLDNLANWDQAAPKQVQKAWRAARDIVGSHLDDAMGKAGLGAEWGEANARFSQARKLSKPDKKGLADIGTERREGNRLGSPSEKASAVAGAIAGSMHDPVAAVAIPAATIALNRYAMPVGARTLDAMSKSRPTFAGTVEALKSDPVKAEAFASWLRGRNRLGAAGADEEDR